jgi:hypothetical protein
MIILTQLKENLDIDVDDINSIDTEDCNINSGVTPGDQDSRQVNLSIYLKV